MFALLPTASTYADSLPCYCILWLREARDINIHGDAWVIQPNKALRYAKVGDVILFDYGGRDEDHGAEILGFEGKQVVSDEEGTYTAPLYVKVIEANYKHCQVSKRKVEWNDPSIKGIFHPHP